MSANFKKTVDTACDLSKEGANQILHGVLGWLSVSSETSPDLDALRDFLTKEIETRVAYEMVHLKKDAPTEQTNPAPI